MRKVLGSAGDRLEQGVCRQGEGLGTKFDGHRLSLGKVVDVMPRFGSLVI